MSTIWSVEEHRGPADEHLWLPEPATRLVRRLEVTRPALILGSSEPLAHVDQSAAKKAGIDIARRRSGGGAVLVAAESTLWVDVSIPAADTLAVADVGRAFHWLGSVWVEALSGFGLEARFHDGALQRRPWSDRVCFAGLGPGEVTVGAAKVVGMSQRRTRTCHLFQCCALLRWDPTAILALLELPAPARARAEMDLGGCARGVGPDAGEELWERLSVALGAPSGT